MTLALVAVLGDGWGMHDGNGGWWILMMLGMVLFWAAIVLGIVWLVRGGFEGRREGRRETAAEILDRRFAEGEIDAEDYRERRQVIANSSR